MYKKLFEASKELSIMLKKLVSSKRRKEGHFFEIEIQTPASTITAGRPITTWEGYGHPRGIESGR